MCFYSENSKFIGTGHFFPNCVAFGKKDTAFWLTLGSFLHTVTPPHFLRYVFAKTSSSGLFSGKDGTFPNFIVNKKPPPPTQLVMGLQPKTVAVIVYLCPSLV